MCRSSLSACESSAESPHGPWYRLLAPSISRAHLSETRDEHISRVRVRIPVETTPKPIYGTIDHDTYELANNESSSNEIRAREVRLTSWLTDSFSHRCCGLRRWIERNASEHASCASVRRAVRRRLGEGGFAMSNKDTFPADQPLHHELLTHALHETTHGGNASPSLVIPRSNTRRVLLKTASYINHAASSGPHKPLAEAMQRASLIFMKSLLLRSEKSLQLSLRIPLSLPRKRNAGWNPIGSFIGPHLEMQVRSVAKSTICQSFRWSGLGTGFSVLSQSLDRTLA